MELLSISAPDVGNRFLVIFASDGEEEVDGLSEISEFSEVSEDAWADGSNRGQVLNRSLIRSKDTFILI